MPFSAEDLDQIRTAVRDVVDSRFNGIEREVQALVRNQPEVAFRHMQRHVVGKGTDLEEKAIGADSTWTYMKHGDKVLAVSAAHCACDHPIQQESRKRKKRRTTSTITDSVPSYDITTKEFIEVPELLAPFVTSVFFLPDVVGDRHPSTYQDIVVVELQDEKSNKFTSMTESNSFPVWRTVAGRSENIAPGIRAKDTYCSILILQKAATAGRSCLTFNNEKKLSCMNKALGSLLAKKILVVTCTLVVKFVRCRILMT
jgi:hypothetical protein